MYGEKDYRVGNALSEYGNCLYKLDKQQEAEKTLEEA